MRIAIPFGYSYPARETKELSIIFTTKFRDKRCVMRELGLHRIRIRAAIDTKLTQPYQKTLLRFLFMNSCLKKGSNGIFLWIRQSMLGRYTTEVQYTARHHKLVPVSNLIWQDPYHTLNMPLNQLMPHSVGLHINQSYDMRKRTSPSKPHDHSSCLINSLYSALHSKAQKLPRNIINLESYPCGKRENSRKSVTIIQASR